MYLKSLEMQGFKSFPDKTGLSFENSAKDGSGVTVIVGPNGSGKSNISDAMRWVLGEISSKNLRGSKMEDVIFGGADSRKPMGYAEVSVTFDNRDKENRLDCPYDEVTVTRRYYRAGESEYFINRRAVRLKDIYELFMNTGIGRDGYSIIGQGRIAEIISRKSDERRSIFEDASGIAKFRHKKSEAERKLQQTEDNMTRIFDIFTEVESQVGTLEKDAEKAKKAIDLLDRKKRADVGIWLYDTEKLRVELGSAQENLNHSSFELQNAEDSIRAMEQQNEKLFAASQSNKQESTRLLGEIQKCSDENHRLDSEYRIAVSNIEHTKDLIENAENSKGSSSRSADEEKLLCEQRLANIDASQKKLEELSTSQKEIDDKIDEQRKKAAVLDDCIAEALNDIHELEKEETDIKVRISVIENARVGDSDKNRSILDEISKYEALTEDYVKQISVKQSAVDGYDKEIAKAAETIDSCMDKLDSLNERADELTKEISNLSLRRDSLNQRMSTIKTMEEQLEGYAGSVRYVMNAYKEGKITDRLGSPCKTIYGPLSKLISVEDKYVTAIETAFGQSLQHIVVEDESTAKAAMYCLKRAEAGRTTFLPVTSMTAQTVTKEMEEAVNYRGYISVAAELVESDPKFKKIIGSLLGRTLVFDNIENATEMSKSLKYRVKVVTLDGQQINVGGSFTGGSVKSNNSGILGRSGEIKRLEAEAEALASDITKLEKELKKYEKEIEEIDDEKFSAQDRRELIEVLRNSEASGMEQLKAKSDANNTLLEKLRSDYESLEKMRAKYEEDITVLKENEKSLRTRIEEISAARSEKDIERNEMLDTIASLETEKTENYIKISEIQKDISTEKSLLEASQSRINRISEELAGYDTRISELNLRIEEYNSVISDNRERLAEGEKLLMQLNEQRSAIEADGDEFEKKLSAMNAKMRDKMSEKELIFREHTKNEARLAKLRDEQEKLSSKLWDEYDMTRNDALELGYTPVDESNRSEVVAVQTECRNKLRAIGNFDIDAVEKYAEVKARYDYMSAQIKDLESSKSELVSIINKLETEMKGAFVDSFNKINENFNRVFGELFGGGSAELSLTDPDNVLESGIEIKAAPPGKIIKNLMQLSGGEQSFVAIALFFAILQVNPTPFCILDEIEAALDEVNVARFSQYISRYSDGTQFILITHRRGTMEAADKLYGVTMPEHGISKVLSLNVNDIAKKGKDEEDWDGIFG